MGWSVELWAPLVVLLPGVDQLFSEPAGQRLTHPVEQLGQLDVVIPIVFPEEYLGLKETKEVRLIHILNVTEVMEIK